MEEVLLLAKVEAGKVELKPAPIDVPTFCRRLTEEIQVSTGRACPISFSGPSKVGEAFGDESLLRHIFINLLSNAVKYSAPGQEVRFSLEREETTAVFQVCDQGIGIPEGDVEQLFQTFHRGSNVGERPGSGLGLVIVKRCVELHGGEISLESRSGEGTIVTVRLPLFTAHPSDSPRRAANPRRSSPAAAKAKLQKPKKKT